MDNLTHKALLGHMEDKMELDDARARIAELEQALAAERARSAGLAAALQTEKACLAEELTGEGYCKSMTHQQRHKAMALALAADAPAIGDEELMKAYEAAHARERWICYHRPNPSGLRAVAAAVQARAGVRISGEDIYDLRVELLRSSTPSARHRTITDWLRDHGVTIEEAQP